MKKYIGCEYRKIFGTFDESDLKNIVREIYFPVGCKILGAFGFAVIKEQRRNINKLFFEVNKSKKIRENIIYLKKNNLITRIGVLKSWKYLIVNQQLCHGKDDNIGKQISLIIKLILIMNQLYLGDPYEEDVARFIVGNHLFNYYDCPLNQSARSYYMFIKNNDLERKYSRINREEIFRVFKAKYGIELKEYLYSLGVIISYVNSLGKINIEQKSMMNFCIDPFKLPNIKKEKIDLIIKVLQMNSISLEDINDADFQYFHKKPFLKVNEIYIPIERKVINDMIFEALFYKINDCFENNDFFNSYGLMFQEYIQYIATKFCNMSLGYYHAVEEFSYSKRKGKRDSSDFYIIHREEGLPDIVLVIEVKSARVLYNINNYSNIKSEDFFKSLERLIKIPLGQAVDCVADIINKDVKRELNANQVFYFLTVTMNNFPLIVNEKIDLQVNNDISKLKIGGALSISIEEFELFLQTLLYPRSQPFNTYLNQYSKQDTSTFKNFLLDFPNVKSISEKNSIYLDPVTKLGQEFQEKYMDFFGIT